MHTQEQYEDTVRRLAQCGYEVLSNEQRYIVRHQTDSNDVSQVRTLDELIELAELMEWAQQRQKTLK